ncbi:helix-turn-helix domain-containing protein [Bacteroides sp. AF20-13LB]|uniref:helix-turn-helix domain-containing protein n=1 Tax=Bacteroides sp. AF20-13LB TaxID=2292921 RepID=UPI000E744C46|nr:helix-turn-helix domain-containing protein [Bacteroides sp. AF20-13LB]RJV38773.1 DNA-binding protein [Bacteroides sp. AF20-13LB]
MSYHFIERKDPHVEVLFLGLENLERMLSDMEKTPKPTFKGERFLTDEELSGILRISRRTLQEYRTLGVIPYYLLQGKVLYKESDIQKMLEDAYKRCREEQRWV